MTSTSELGGPVPVPVPVSVPGSVGAPDGCVDEEGRAVPCPAPEDLDLATVLAALSDPVRLRVVAELADGGERTCGSFALPVSKSTCSHHFRVLREAGLTSQRIGGTNRYNRLRREVVDRRFPGLLDAVLGARDAG